MKPKKISVIGDIMLDTWSDGRYEKKSAEAPIKIFELNKLNYSLGGVGNLCVNLKSLKVNYTLFTELGFDENGKKILDLLKKENIKFYISNYKKHTTVKERFYVDNKQIFRKDIETKTKISKIDNKIINKIKNKDLIVISDYNKGTINKNIIKKLNKKIVKYL